MPDKIINLKEKSENTEGDTLLSWEIKERSKRDKKTQIIVVLSLILFLLFTIWQKNLFGSILAIVVGFLLFLPKSSKEKYFAILKRGVRRENELFSWQKIKSFWIFEDAEEIYFSSKNKLTPYKIIFPIPKDYIGKARTIISKFAKEEEVERDFFDIISKRVGL